MSLSGSGTGIDVDLPFVGRYRWEYDRIADRLRELNRTTVGGGIEVVGSCDGFDPSDVTVQVTWASGASASGTARGDLVTGKAVYSVSKSGSALGYAFVTARYDGPCDVRWRGGAGGVAFDQPGAVVFGSTFVKSSGFNVGPTFQLLVYPTVDLRADRTAVDPGETVELTYDSTNADRLTLSTTVDRSLRPPSGVAEAVVNSPTTFTLTGSGPAGERQTSVRVGISPPAITSFTVDDDRIAVGETATLSWQTERALAVEISSGVGLRPPTGEAGVRPEETTLYTLTARGYDDQERTAAVRVAVVDPPTVSLSAVPATIVRGSRTELVWQSTGADRLEINNGVGTVQGPSGRQSLRPLADRTYRITATGEGGQTTATVSVDVRDYLEVTSTLTLEYVGRVQLPQLAGPVDRFQTTTPELFGGDHGIDLALLGSRAYVTQVKNTSGHTAVVSNYDEETETAWWSGLLDDDDTTDDLDDSPFLGTWELYTSPQARPPLGVPLEVTWRVDA